MKRPRNLKKKLLLVMFGVVFGLTMSELFLRVVGYSFPLFYSTDLVILAFTTYNDVYDNSRAISKTEDVPYFIYRNGQLTYDASFRDSATYRQRDSRLNQAGRWIHNHLRTMQLIHYLQFVTKERLANWRDRRRRAAQPSPSPGSPQNALRPEDVGIENMTYLEPKADD